VNRNASIRRAGKQLTAMGREIRKSRYRYGATDEGR
jgi:hypothetical protein